MDIIKQRFVILGNGFSIDLIHKLQKADVIQLSNLFAAGDHVCFPKTNEKGFLSAKYCPNLWKLGVNTTISTEIATKYMNDIITCANVYNLSSKSRTIFDSEYSVYIEAYFELSSYLRYLFIHYDSLVSDAELQNLLDLPFLQYIRNAIASGDKIHIITYNYDIWLERLLQLSGIVFSIHGFDTKKSNITIYKPHGSISFSFRNKTVATAPYEIKRNTDFITQKIEDFDVIYHFENDFPLVNAMIPPSGDSNRYGFGWGANIRDNIKAFIQTSQPQDELLIFGLSYWHVDRNEIDDILIHMNTEVNVKYVNPNPPSDFNAVLFSLFKKYIHYTSGDLLI